MPTLLSTSSGIWRPGPLKGERAWGTKIHVRNLRLHQPDYAPQDTVVSSFESLLGSPQASSMSTTSSPMCSNSISKTVCQPTIKALTTRWTWRAPKTKRTTMAAPILSFQVVAGLSYMDKPAIMAREWKPASPRVSYSALLVCMCCSALLIWPGISERLYNSIRAFEQNIPTFNGDMVLPSSNNECPRGMTKHAPLLNQVARAISRSTPLSLVATG